MRRIAIFAGAGSLLGLGILAVVLWRLPDRFELSSERSSLRTKEALGTAISTGAFGTNAGFLAPFRGLHLVDVKEAREFSFIDRDESLRLTLRVSDDGSNGRLRAELRQTGLRGPVAKAVARLGKANLQKPLDALVERHVTVPPSP